MAVVMTLTFTDMNAVRLVGALDAAGQRLPEESARDMIRRCIKGWLQEKVYAHEGRLAMAQVLLDENLVSIP